MIKINLAPPTTKKRGGIALPGMNLGLLFGGLALALVVVLAVWWIWLASEISSLAREIDKNEKEAARLQTIIAEGERFRRDKEALEARVNAIESVARNQTRPVYMLNALLETVPKDLWLTRMEEKGGQLRFAGVAYSSVAVSDFMSNLKASGKFKDIDLVDARQDLTKSPRTVTFEVSCRFET
ncbi:MAG TPA: PilN domain-containing protein [Methylomirabilota bacterium]|nr:PilN domain-containing protein [Methylomirabilota bacterium]